MKFKKKLMATAVAGIAGAAQMAYAADAPVLEEVIVTAQKIEENIQKIPVSVTAMGSNELEKRGITNAADLVTVRLPGVTFAPFAGRTDTLNMTMRGAQTSDPTQGTTDGAVAILVDDVYNARGTGVNFGVAEIERMEILRGPQGTLFGRNALGGAIRIITKQPTGEFGGNVKLNIGNYGYNSEEAHINTQEVGGFSFKFDLKQESRDGFVKNASTTSALSKHRDFGELDNQGGKFTVLFKATDRVKLAYSYDDLELKQTKYYDLHALAPSICQGGVACGGASALYANPPNSVGDYPDTTWIGMYNDWAVTKVKSHRFNVDWDLGDNLTFKSITTHTETDSLTTGNNLNGAYSFTSFGGFNIAQIGRRTPAALGTNGIAAAGLTGANQIYGMSGVLPESLVTSKATSQEFQLIGNTDNLKWVVGTYWYKEDSEDSRYSLFTIAYTGFAGGRPINPVATNPFWLTTAAGPDDTSSTRTQSHVKAYSLFGQATWTPASMQQLHITGGLRYSHENRTFHRSVDAGLPVSIDKPTFSKGRWDPTISVAYDLNDTTNVYARYASAYRAGGASVRAPWVGAFSNLATYEEEVDKSLEFGIKSDLMDRRLRLNAVYYITKLKNEIWSVQLNPVNPSITGTVNLPGEQESKGIELEATFAATDRLTLSGNLTWQRFTIAPEVQGFINATDAGALYYPAPFPKYAGMVAADYTMPAPVGQVVLHADWAKSSKSAGTPRIPRANFNIPVWTDVINARVSWQGIKMGATTLKLSGYVKNLANTHAPNFSATSGQWNPQPPRTYGLEASLDF